MAELKGCRKTKLGIYHWWELPQVSLLSRQKFCHDKHVFCRNKHVFCHDKNMLVATKLLSQQNCVCHDKRVCHNKPFFTTNISTKLCRDKIFVATSIFMLRQKWYFWQLLPKIGNQTYETFIHQPASPPTHSFNQQKPSQAPSLALFCYYRNRCYPSYRYVGPSSPKESSHPVLSQQHQQVSTWSPNSFTAMTQTDQQTETDRQTFSLFTSLRKHVGFVKWLFYYSDGGQCREQTQTAAQRKPLTLLSPNSAAVCRGLPPRLSRMMRAPPSFSIQSTTPQWPQLAA